jgi:hypothetical protein
MVRLARSMLVLAIAPWGCNDGPASAESFGEATGGSSTSTTGVDAGTGSAGTSAGTGVNDTGSHSSDTGQKFDLPVPDAGGGTGNVIPETCEEADAGESTVGCRFFAIDTDLVVVYDPNQFAIAVANVQLDQIANVTLEVDDGAGYAPVEPAVAIDPLDLHVFLPPDRHVDASGLAPHRAYRISSDVPVIGYQINPYVAGESYTSDASLLYPVASWDTLHYVLAQPKINSAQESYFTVVAATDGTTVTVTPSVATKAGNGVPAGAAGMPFAVDLDEGDMLQVAASLDLADPTGTKIESNLDHPVAVFTGNTCALVPLESAACDHLQEQMFGVRQWGTDFVASRMAVRSTQGAPEPSLWQILASEDGTTVTFSASAAVTGVPAQPAMLDAGEALELYVSGTFAEPGDFIVQADKPIALANTMTGSSTVMPSGRPSLGDPSVVQLAPVEQFLPRYVILVPPEYWMWDVGTITRPAGVEIRLDGVAIPDADFIPVGPAHEVARVPLTDNVHVLEGDAPFSIVVVGYDDDDSYAYLGGTGTAVINPNPEG